MENFESKSHRQIIDLIGVDEVASHLDKPKAAVMSWRDRDNIPARYWYDLAWLGDINDGDVLWALAHAAKWRHSK